MTKTIDKVTGEVTSREVANPGYWAWQYHIINLWDRPKGVDYKLVGFAIIMASNGRDGRNLHASARYLAGQTGLSERWVKKLRNECVEIGLFRHTGVFDKSGIENLEITIPSGVKSSADAETPAQERGGELQCMPGVNSTSPNTYMNHTGSYKENSELQFTPPKVGGEPKIILPPMNELPYSSAGELHFTPVQSSDSDIDPADILDEMNEPELVTHCVYCHCRTCERNGAFGWFPGSEKYVEPSEPCQCKDCKTAESQSQPDYQFGSWPADSIGAEMADRITAA